MVENNKINTETSGAVDNVKYSVGYIKVLEMKINAEKLENDDEKMLFVLKDLGEEWFIWFTELEECPVTWENFKAKVTEKINKNREERSNELKKKEMREEIIKELRLEFKQDNRYKKRNYTYKEVRRNDDLEKSHIYDNEVRCYVCNEIGHFVRGCAKRLVNKTRKTDYSKVSDVVNYDYFINENGKKYKVTLDHLKYEFPKVLIEDIDEKVKFCSIEKCYINTEPGKIIVKRGAYVHQSIREKVKKHIDSLLKRGIIRESQSQWRNPIRALEKPDGGIRLVSNLAALNDLAFKDLYSLPIVRRIVEATVGSNYITIIDLKEGYYHFEIAKEHKEKTAFKFDRKVYEWNGMVMGYKNFPMIFRRIIDKIFKDELVNGVEGYLDDLIIHAKIIEEHDILVRKVLKKLGENNLKVNIKKIQFDYRKSKC